MKKEGIKGEIDMTLVAMMEDRYLMSKDRRQIYGTQGTHENIEKNGKEYEIQYVWPIRSPKKVNQKRKEIGFKESVEENSKRLFGKDFVYKVYTLKDIRKKRIIGKQVNN